MIELFKNIKNGLKSIKWAISKNGREYIKNQKIEQTGIKFSCDIHKNCNKIHEK